MAALLGLLAIVVPTRTFPGIGNTWAVGIAFMLHITIAEFSIGAILLAVAMELYAYLKGGDARALRYARALVNSYYLIFSVGATFAVFAVIMLLGLWSNFIGTLLNQFLPLVILAFGIMMVLAPLLLWYRNTAKSMRPGRHLLLGIIVAILQSGFLVFIVGIDAYLITPSYTALGSLGDPAYFPLLFLRFLGSVSWTALFLAAYAVIALRRASTDEEKRFQGWAAWVNVRIGTVFLLTTPVAGYILLAILKGSAAGYFDNLLVGTNAWEMVLSMVIFSIALIAVNVGLGWGEGGGNFSTVALVLVVAGCIVGSLPSSIIGSSILAVRYIGLAVACVTTLVHLIVRTASGPEMEESEPMAHVVARHDTNAPIAFEHSGSAQWAVIIAGFIAAALALYMGYLKEDARGTYVVYGVLHQSVAQQHYSPPQGTYPS